MPNLETPRQRGARRGREALRRLGDELRLARTGAGLSSRTVGRAIGISDTQVLRIERAQAPRVDLGVLARFASVVGCELSVRVFVVARPVRDAAHLTLLGRLRRRLHPSWQWSAEVPVPIVGDQRSADAVIRGSAVAALVEAETRIGDVQALLRRLEGKARDMDVTRVILLVLDSRHNRAVIRDTTELRDRFPIGTRAALGHLGRGEDPGGDCLILL